MTGPAFTKPPRFNHIAVSVERDLLDEAGRRDIVAFYGDLLGAAEHAEMTVDRARLVLGLHTHEQFFFIVGNDEPMRAPVGDHVGVSVSTLADFNEVARRAAAVAVEDAPGRAAAWRDRLPGEVELIDPAQEDFAGVLRLHSFYVRYRLPIMVEVQHFEFLASP